MRAAKSRVRGASIAAAWTMTVMAAWSEGCGDETTFEPNDDAGSSSANDIHVPDASTQVDDGGRTSSDAGATTPASGDAGLTCDVTKPFGAPIAVTELNVFPAQYGARLSEDMLRVVFHADWNGVTKLFESTRTSPSGVFEAPSFISGLSTSDGGAAEEGAFPSLDSDGRTIYFESNRGGRVQIWWASRPQPDASFADPAVVSGLVDPQNTGQPYLTNGGEIFFISRHALAPSGALGGTDIYSGSVVGAGTVTQGFAQPSELETTSNDYAPIVSADGREAFFSRLMLDDGGASATFRIWTATRVQGASVWTNLAPAVAFAGSAGNDLASWISTDRCTLYLASDRQGAYKIYRAIRPF